MTTRAPSPQKSQTSAAEKPKPASQSNPNLLRDRLANERTFLAWLRTGIAVSSLGFVVARFDIFLQQLTRASSATAAQETVTPSRATIPIGLVLIGAGPLMVLMASLRYLHTERALQHGRSDSRRLVPGMVMLITTACLVAGTVLMLHLISLWPK